MALREKNEKKKKKPKTKQKQNTENNGDKLAETVDIHFSFFVLLGQILNELLL